MKLAVVGPVNWISFWVDRAAKLFQHSSNQETWSFVLHIILIVYTMIEIDAFKISQYWIRPDFAFLSHSHATLNTPVPLMTGVGPG
jgi:hypothetical protein